MAVPTLSAKQATWFDCLQQMLALWDENVGHASCLVWKTFPLETSWSKELSMCSCIPAEIHVV